MAHSFLQHYLAYLGSIQGLTAILVVAPLLYILRSSIFAKATAVSRSPLQTAIPGCVRFCLRGESSLKDQYQHSQNDCEDAKARVKALFVYPIKSCKGIELPSCGVLKTGLAYDRLFTFAQALPIDEEGSDDDRTEPRRDRRWRFITQREYPKLALVETELWVPDPRLVKAVRSDSILPAVEKIRGRRDIVDEVDDWSANGGCLVVRFPDASSSGGNVTFRLPLSPTTERALEKKYVGQNIQIWRDDPLSMNVTGEIEPDILAKLESFLRVKHPLGLFRSDDDNLRHITRSLPPNRRDEHFSVGFADAFPVHILNLASARAIDDLMPRESQSKGKLDALRFRANIYVAGPPAYAEDQWKRVAMGRTTPDNEAAEYHAACRTARCNLPNVDPKTGLRDRNEPGTTLRRTRQVDEGAKPHPTLGLSMIPLFDRGIISVGDDIDVLETGVHVYEKMFA